MLDIGEKEPVINMNKIRLSSHAMDRLKSRLNIKDEKAALKFVKNILEKGEYLGEIINESDEKNSLYSHNGNMILLNKHDFTIITVMQKEYEYIHDKIRSQYVSICTKEIRKLNRKERSLHRRMKEYTLDYNIQIALLEHRMYKTRSKNVVKMCKCEKDKLDKELKELKMQIRKLQEEKRKVAYSLSLVI